MAVAVARLVLNVAWDDELMECLQSQNRRHFFPTDHGAVVRRHVYLLPEEPEHYPVDEGASFPLQVLAAGAVRWVRVQWRVCHDAGTWWCSPRRVLGQSDHGAVADRRDQGTVDVVA